MKKSKFIIEVNLTGITINLVGNDITINETIHGCLGISTKQLLRGNKYQQEKVQQFLN